MRQHLFRLVLRQWIEHRDPDNLRLPAIINPIGWLALTTLLSQVPLPVGVPLLGDNLGLGSSRSRWCTGCRWTDGSPWGSGS